MLQPTEAPRSVELAIRQRLAIPEDYASLDHLDFLESREAEIVASGWMGAGKSRVLCQKAWMVARRYPGVTVALFRKAQNSIGATTERTFERDVVELEYLSPGHAGRNKSEHWWGLANGSRIYFLGLDPDPLTGVPSKVGSLDLGWAGVDEAVELTEEDWIMLLGRLRDPRMPWHQLAAATNPGPPKHWLRRRMADGHLRMVNIKANKFLTPEYVAMLRNLPDTAAGRRLGKGIWAGAEGQIFMIPDDQVRRVPLQPWRRVVAGIDWGYQHPFACEVIAETGLGKRHVVAELYIRGRTLKDIIPDLKALVAKYGIGVFYADPSEPAYIDECRQNGLPVQEATNDVLPGITAVTEEIANGLAIDPDCQGLLGEVPGYVWASDRNGIKDQPVKLGDDACDALRYAVMGLRGTTSGNWSMVA